MSESDPLQKINWCLRVKEIDPTEGSAPQKINWCLRVKEIDPTEGSALQKKIRASGSKRSTPPKEAHCKK